MTPPPTALASARTRIPEAPPDTRPAPAEAPLPDSGPQPTAPPPVAPPPAAGRPAAGPVVILVGILLVALNLRAAITSLGALLDEVRTGLALSGAVAGFVTTLPALAFALFGSLTPRLVRRYSAARVLVAAMLALAAGQLLRVATDSTVVFLVTSALALGGIAVANILLPMLVRQYFPHRVGLVTGAYSMTMTVGATVAAAAAVPVGHALGSWRAGLAVWALLAAVAVLPWVPAALRAHAAARRPSATPVASVPLRIRPGRTRLGWAMGLYFGTQALGAYALMGWLAQLFRDAGYTAGDAGLLLAAVTAVGVPIALLMPTLAGRMRTLHPLILVLSAAMLLAYLGLAVAPYRGALVWAVLLAVGQSAFPMLLATIGLRARTTEGTVALSAFAQSVGYLIAALGPLLVGVLYDVTGGWVAPIGFLLVALVVQTAAGMVIARPRFIEDER
ncbi:MULTISPECIES: MFS transporter [Micromonospora]|uniref:MFS transporter, CP family, cyanate transporter n=1 Tax=Micromonospora yangpuensis TaxID=683228 RepID=A0A1C6TYR2_9ACTN|nr:MFS transporter [Micromonospora yangpuensis]GGM20562.1 MFS transporter [Micromonospora yangpuensis]SCL46897.1 MFS transporter, CP family, cyanate transporter [Micromonospora yangpuensis]